MKKTSLQIFMILALAVGAVFAQTTEFTYQGSLRDAASPASGNYDFEFLLFDAAAGGMQLGSTLARNGVAVAGGTFAVNLDFGNQFPGANRFLEIRVRPAGGGAFTPLAPRQQFNSAPYSVKAVNATNAASADSLSGACIGCVTNNHINSLDGSKIAGTVANATTAANALQLGGLAAGQYVLTGDARLSDARAPTAGSANYVQNTSVQQAASNFNISGTGTAGGTLSGNIVNADTQYNIGGSRVLSVAGTNNLFAGFGTGVANTVGFNNSFFGRAAGAANTSGINNSFFGSLAGDSNATGGQNSFFGRSAGQANTSGGDNSFFGFLSGDNNATGGNNSFFGSEAGLSNTTGSNNTIIGDNANVGSGNLSFATAIGAGAVVTSHNTIALGRSAGQDAVQIPGALSVTGALTANGSALTNLNATNITTGTLNAVRLPVPLTLTGTSAAAIIRGENASTGNTSSGVMGVSSAATGNTFGVWGWGSSTSGIGVLGYAAALNGTTYGGLFQNASTSGRGVSGEATAATGFTYGGRFESSSTSGRGVTGFASAVTGTTYGVWGSSNSTSGYGGYFDGRGYFRDNVGIGTTAPNAKLQVAGGSVYIQQPNSLIITSPNGACWFITVGNTGVLSTISVTCP